MTSATRSASWRGAMDRIPLVAIIAAIVIAVAAFDFWSSAKFIGSILFIFPLALCAAR